MILIPWDCDGGIPLIAFHEKHWSADVRPLRASQTGALLSSPKRPPGIPSSMWNNLHAASARQNPSQPLQALPGPVQIAIVNVLEPGERVEFVLLGDDSEAVCATDRRLVVAPKGRNPHNRLWAATYASLANSTIEQTKNGGVLQVIDARERKAVPVAKLSGAQQVERGIQAVQWIRVKIASFQEAAQVPARPMPVGMSHASTLTLGDMLAMNPTEFEEFTGRALEAMGYTSVQRVGGAGDLSADLTATDPQGRSSIVQCKRYTPGSKVGSPAIQSFIGMKSIHHRAQRGIFVTTAEYSQQAIDLAKQHDIVLIDGDDLVKIAALVLTPARPVRYPGDQRPFCRGCGEQAQPGSKFCGRCGARLSSS